ncbi:protein serine/threonine phosphatase 2C [Guyanagaster necrorhizus]|uniref:Protein serine/threonine phosphatase 2C n=1 Tax=Guyanagaster necrorhizus TaxID=856835 RepID=A0A9P7VFL9_9AGAR|nr:protein serine/threonine phosphatase 2C [Guyanagaster necrorhizus MCA 3950]KAG7439660.1 protein serine/threonine phosphatase 2C [Guyanagaster necrorhizus MCA 3950]
MTAGVHSVTFQPTPGARNEDRFVVHSWLIDGRRWKFLAVFDGHGSAHTSEYAAANLPRFIEEELRHVVVECRNRSRDTLIRKVKKALRQRIEDFDEAIGDAVKNLCPDPFTLNYPQAVALVDANKHILQRAYSGSTLALALIDEDRDNMWLAGLGDSTVALACEDPDGIGYGEAPLPLHSTHTPKEYITIAMMHPSEEKDDIMENGQLLGAVPYTRGLGDYGLKFPSEFSTELFFKLPRGQRPQRYRDGIRYCNVTPPYVLNSPSTRFIDLTELRPHKSTLILYTHGVDAIVNGETPGDQRIKKPDGPDPSVIVGTLVGSKVDEAFAQETLGHGVEIGWIGSDGNRAVELLGNLLAGTSVEMFARFLRPRDSDRRLYLDDTTILRYELVRATNVVL